MRRRLDLELAHRGLTPSRQAAQLLILEGRVRVDSRPADKPDLKVDERAIITVIGRPHRYASRGALKLAAALDHFGIPTTGRDALDIGASSGGFSDLLLERGVSRVIALDVGYGQLDLRLRNDPRVFVMERTNIRHLNVEDLPWRPDLVVIDVSFISLRLVLPAALVLAARPADFVALVKPQFEVGKGKVGKGGVVRDPEVRRAAVAEVVEFARALDLAVSGPIESPITGPAGNVEMLVWMRKETA